MEGLVASKIDARYVCGDDSAPASRRPGDDTVTSAQKPGRTRADVVLVARGLAPSREKARALVIAGEVLAGTGERVIAKPGELIADDEPLRLRTAPMPFVSRGGLKLAHALRTFAVDVQGRVAVDVGASTGGFTDCLLQAGAARVYAIDVGQAQLDWKIASDARVVVMDKTNVRHLEAGALPEPCDLAVIDVSFISLRLVLPGVRHLVRPAAPVIALVKPQFEVGRADVGKGGIVRDPVARARAVREVQEAAAALGFTTQGVTPSPILGGADGKGNEEFLLWISAPPSP